MSDINYQADYWNRVAYEKEFSHPINISLLQTHLPLSSHILDYGCGYGRVCSELANVGYTNIVGVDISSEMIRRGCQINPDLTLEILPPVGLLDHVNTFDAVLLFAVLTCIPTNEGQLSLISNLNRALRSGGLIYISDYLLQDDEHNLRRYQQYANEFGTYGIFRLQDGAIVRHHHIEWIFTLTSDFEMVDMEYLKVVTMNGHQANAFQYLGQISE